MEVIVPLLIIALIAYQIFKGYVSTTEHKSVQAWADSKTDADIEKIRALPADKQLDAVIQRLDNTKRLWLGVYIIASIIGFFMFPIVVIIPIFLGAKYVHNKWKECEEAKRLARQMIP